MSSTDMNFLNSSLTLFSSSNTSKLCSSIENNPGSCNLSNIKQNLSSINNGNRSTDTQLVNYVCGMCHIDFPDKSCFDYHCANHTDIKPDVCDTCHKIFTSNANKDNHICSTYALKISHIRTSLENVSEIEMSSDTDVLSNFNSHPYDDKINKEISVKHPLCSNYSKLKTGTSCKENASSTNIIDAKPKSTNICEFTCKICNKILSSKSTLTRHLSRHLKKTQHYCYTCGEMFIFKDNLVKHAFKYSEEMHGCKRCKLHFNCDEELLKHVCKRKSFPCLECKQIFFSKDRLNDHIDEHSKLKLNVCDVNGSSQTPKSQLINQKSLSDSTKSYVCEICHKSLQSERNLMLHKQAHARKQLYVCELCRKQFTSRGGLMRHFNTHTNYRPYSCELCSSRYFSRSALSKHFLTHSEEKILKCDICGKVLSTRSNFRTHMKIHVGELSFNCKECGKGFAAQKLLSQHAMVHLDRKPFVCIICDRSFRKNRDLTMHYNTHAADKPFKCDSCDKKFCSAIALKLHQGHHDGKQHVCEICNKSFPLKLYLNRHLIGHKNEKKHICYFCSAAFISKNGLRRHYFTHTGEKPHVCDVCQKGFTQRQNLRVHQRVHSEEKPFVCSHCPKQYTTKQSLVHHLRTVHSSENQLDSEE